MPKCYRLNQPPRARRRSRQSNDLLVSRRAIAESGSNPARPHTPTAVPGGVGGPAVFARDLRKGARRQTAGPAPSADCVAVILDPDRLLSEPTTAAQPWLRERPLLPHTCRSQYPSRSVHLAGKLSFASPAIGWPRCAAKGSRRSNRGRVTANTRTRYIYCPSTSTRRSFAPREARRQAGPARRKATISTCRGRTPSNLSTIGINPGSASLTVGRGSSAATGCRSRCSGPTRLL